MDKYRKKALILLTAMMILFFLIFLYAYFQLQKGSQIFDIGLPGNYETKLVMGLSILSIIKIIYEIYKVERH